MHTKTLLVIGSEDNEPLIDALFATGATIAVRHTLEGAVDLLRHETPAAVVVDCASAPVDPLEVVLNVRDLSNTAPVVVVGAGGEAEKRLLKGFDQTVLVDANDGHATAVRRRIEALLRPRRVPKASTPPKEKL